MQRLFVLPRAWVRQAGRRATDAETARRAGSLPAAGAQADTDSGCVVAGDRTGTAGAGRWCWRSSTLAVRAKMTQRFNEDI